MWRFTRLTNAFSKKVENHAYAVALDMMYYKLRPHPIESAGRLSNGANREAQQCRLE